MIRSVALTIGAVLLAYTLWWSGGLLEAWTGLDDLDVLGRVVIVFAGLTGAEMAFSRLSR